MKRNKAILSIVLILLVLLVGVATIFISSRISQQQAVAPTAPTSEPFAAETTTECKPCSATVLCATGLTCDGGICEKADGTSTCWVGSTACTTTATTLCVASSVKTCTPDCPTACGHAASTISSCKDSCGVATTKACAATSACGEDVTIEKRAYKNEAGNTAGNYTLSTEISTVAKNQTFVYAILLKNTGALTATNITVTDTLDGENQNLLTFVDSRSACTFSATTKAVTCSGISLAPEGEGVYAFRVKVSDAAVNGDVIKNVAVLTVPGSEGVAAVVVNATNELTVSTVVGCNHTCTGDAECGTGLVCDTGTNKCRKEACVDEDTCVCAVATAAPIARPTARPTAVRTAAPTREITEAPARIVEVVEPTVLPETGILDFPGVAAFGGGLMLAVVGILLAL